MQTLIVTTPIHAVFAGTVLFSLLSPANAACDCNCVKSNGAIATAQSVNSNEECVSACSVASKVWKQTLTPSSPSCTIVKTNAEIMEWCSDKPIPADAKAGEGVTHGTKPFNRRNDACVDIPNEWTKVNVWCEVKTDAKPLYQCVGVETSSSCGDISWFRREGVVVKDLDTVCVRSFNEESFETRYSVIKVAPVE